MAGYKGERFRGLSMLAADGGVERVTAQLGMDGLKILTPDGGLAKRSYDLSHISRWQASPGTLVLFTKTPVDVEERPLTLSGDADAVRSLLDTLTSCCMQCVARRPSPSRSHTALLSSSHVRRATLAGQPS